MMPTFKPKDVTALIKLPASTMVDARPIMIWLPR
jgi:hypothetical protein